MGSFLWSGGQMISSCVLKVDSVSLLWRYGAGGYDRRSGEMMAFCTKTPRGNCIWLGTWHPALLIWGLQRQANKATADLAWSRRDRYPATPRVCGCHSSRARVEHGKRARDMGQRAAGMMVGKREWWWFEGKRREGGSRRRCLTTLGFLLICLCFLLWVHRCPWPCLCLVAALPGPAVRGNYVQARPSSQGQMTLYLLGQMPLPWREKEF